jgi:hypothetical protein
MAGGYARHKLVADVNNSFQASKIADTAAKVGPLTDTHDTFDILHALGHFELPDAAALDKYRNDLSIPAINRAAMDLAFRAAITEKCPLSFAVVSGHAESLQITVSDTLISVILTRVD